MRAEDLEFNEDATAFEDLPAEAVVVVIVHTLDAVGLASAAVYLRPDTPYADGDAALRWAAALLTRTAEVGLARAAEMDGWESREDGGWQIVGRTTRALRID